MTSPSLFEPAVLRGSRIRNRLWVSPMCQYSCDDESGVPTDWHLMHLGQFAAGGAGLVMTEATAVSPEGRITAEDTGIWNDAQREAWTRIVRLVRSLGATPAIQLAHAGRKASDYRLFDERTGSTRPPADGGWETVAPSAIPYPGFNVPRTLDLAAIDQVVDDFAQAARRSVEAGFEVVEIHAAHGYLLHQFLSPLSNERSDEYGGSLENRARLLLRIVRAVRAAIGDQRALFVRMSATDWCDGAWDEHATAKVARWASALGVDLFDISTGGLIDGVQIPVAEGYQVRFAEHVAAAADVMTNAVGLITTPEYADRVVRTGQAAAVMVGREFLRDPHFALRAAQALGIDIDYWPRQYKAVEKRRRTPAAAAR